MNRVPGVASSGNFRIDATLASLSWGPPISSENPADMVSNCRSVIDRWSGDILAAWSGRSSGRVASRELIFPSAIAIPTSVDTTDLVTDQTWL